MKRARKRGERGGGGRFAESCQKDSDNAEGRRGRGRGEGKEGESRK